MKTRVTQPLQSTWHAVEGAFPKDSVARILLQFILIVMSGAVLSHYFALSRERDARSVMMSHQRSQDRSSLIEAITKDTYRRLFSMQLVYWEVSLHNELSDFRQSELIHKYDAYYQQLASWNALLPFYAKAIGSHFRDAAPIIHSVALRRNYELPPLINPDTYTHTVLQRSFEEFHRLLKAARDKRLEAKAVLSEEELQTLKSQYDTALVSIGFYIDSIHDVSWALDLQPISAD